MSNFHIIGKLSIADCRAIVATLGTGAKPPLRIDGESLNLTELFQKIADMLNHDVVAPGAALLDLLQIPRRIVVSIAAAEGQSL